MSAADNWREALANWAIPDEILAAAPESPWGFSVAGFAARAVRHRQRPTPGHVRAREALPKGGSVLDIGCGGGAASLPLIPPAATATGVDESGAMLAAYADGVLQAGADVSTIEGRWPDVAPAAPVADVVVCQDVLYNVPDLAEFVVALTQHARRRVVVVIPPAHPLVWMNPYWERLHGIQRPIGPTVDDAVAVIASTAVNVERERFTEPTQWGHADLDEAVATVRKRLCLPADRDDDIRAVIADVPMPIEREACALWWPGEA